jgi:hypothetical protein
MSEIDRLKEELIHLRHELGVWSSRTVRLELLVANRLGVDPPPLPNSTHTITITKPERKTAEAEMPRGFFQGEGEQDESTVVMPVLTTPKLKPRTTKKKTTGE